MSATRPAASRLNVRFTLTAVGISILLLIFGMLRIASAQQVLANQNPLLGLDSWPAHPLEVELKLNQTDLMGLVTYLPLSFFCFKALFDLIYFGLKDSPATILFYISLFFKKQRLQGTVIRKVVHQNFVGVIVRCTIPSTDETRDINVGQKITECNDELLFAEVGDTLHFSLKGPIKGSFELVVKDSSES